MSSSYLIKFLKTTAIIFLVDIFWLMTVGNYVGKMTQQIQGQPMRLRTEGAVMVYIFLSYLLLQTETSKEAFFTGLSIYGVYDFTNYALIQNYDLKFAIADTLWGGVLFLIAHNVIKKLN